MENVVLSLNCKGETFGEDMRLTILYIERIP